MKEMAGIDVSTYLRVLPKIRQIESASVWMTFDKEADVLYVNFKKPSFATDSELTDEDIIIRYEGDQVIGLTILHELKTVRF